MSLKPLPKIACAALALTLVVGSVTSCGFRPIYAEKHAPVKGLKDQLNTVSVDAIDGRSGQILRFNIENQLTPNGPPTTPRYFLTVTLDESTSRLGVKKDSTTSRANMRLNASFRLSPAEGEEGASFNGTAQSVVSYNILTSTYGTVSAEKNARVRGLKEISHLITQRLSGHFAAIAQAQSKGGASR